MHVLPEYKRILLLTEGQLGVFTSKTAASLLRYRADDVVAVVDSTCAERELREFIPWAPARPIVARVADTPSPRAEALFVGVAPVGGELPEAMRAHVSAALGFGLDVVSGLHTALGVDEEFAAAARSSGARILDLRIPPAECVVASGRALGTRCRRILTVGADCNVGKMVVALELVQAARQRGLDARFAATGQTGIMIAGRGVAIDGVVSDFAAGAVEQLVLDAADSEVCVVEGQGSLGHAGYSGVTLSIMHGCCPDAMILVHHAGRTAYSAEPQRSLPPLRELVHAMEAAAGLVRRARVVGVGLNTFGAEQAAARAEARRLESELGVPVADPVRDGCAGLLEAALRD